MLVFCENNVLVTFKEQEAIEKSSMFNVLLIVVTNWFLGVLGSVNCTALCKMMYHINILSCIVLIIKKEVKITATRLDLP